MNYEEDIRIDDQMLDMEWLEQPSRMFKYCSYAAKIKMELDIAKERVEMVKAELDKKIRTAPGDYGLEKITETAVGNVIILQPDYRAATNDMIQKKYEADVAINAVRAMDQRKDALENLVRLFGQSYFAGPKVPHDLSQMRITKSASTPNLQRTK